MLQTILEKSVIQILFTIFSSEIDVENEYNIVKMAEECKSSRSSFDIGETNIFLNGFWVGFGSSSKEFKFCESLRDFQDTF